MLFAIPIIAAVVVSYIQFGFINYDEYTWVRSFMWDVLEDLKGVMRRHTPLWMQPISAGAPKLALPAPIPVKDLSLVKSQIPIAISPPGELQMSYFFKVLGCAVIFICLTIIYAFWISMATPTLDSTTPDQRRKYTRKPRLIIRTHLVARPSAPASGPLLPISDLVSPNPPVLDSHSPAPSVTRIHGLVNSSFPMAPTVIESRLAPPLLDSTPATANESTWEALRVSSPIEFPESMNGTMSIYWRRKLMVMGDARRNNGRQINITEIGVVYPTPSTLPVIREESPNSQNLDNGTSTAPASCDNSTLLAAHELTEGSESSIGDTPGCSHIQMDSRDLEKSLGTGSAATTTWVESMALRDSLSRPATQNVTLDATDGTKPPSMQDVGDLLPVKSFDHENAWANHNVDNSELPIDSAGMPLDSPDRENGNAYDCSECIKHLCTCSGSSTSLGWMSQCSASTGLGSPLVTPSNSLPHVSQVDGPSAEDPHDVQSSCMDFIFENQLSRTGSSSPPQPGSPSLDTSRFDSFVQIPSNGSSPANSDTVPAPKLSPESQMLQYFLDDRTYAEVAGLPSDIESARATFSLSRWRVPRSASQRSLPNSPSSIRSVSDMIPGSWAGHGSADSMCARPLDPNARGFGSRRGRGERVEPV